MSGQTNDDIKNASLGMLLFPTDVERLPNGNTLIADAGNEVSAGSKVLEISPDGQVVWSYSKNLKFAHSAKQLPNGNILIADTNNNRVLEVDRDKNVVFTSENWDDGKGNLSDGTHLHYPNDVHFISEEKILITDRNNNRAIVVDKKGKVHKEYKGKFRHPHNCDLLPNGDILVADSDGNRVYHLTKTGKEVWSYGNGEPDKLYWPRDIDVLRSGNYLITDSKNHRILEIDNKGNIVWSYKVGYFANFYEADRLSNGNTLISDQQHHQVFEVDKAGNIIWKFHNYRRQVPVYSNLINGSFRDIKGKIPQGWILNDRLSEGGGKLIWGRDGKGKECPGLEYERNGVLYLQQNVAVKPNHYYKMGARVRAELKNAIVFLQMAFLDDMGGLICDAARSPKGRLITETTDWIEDSFGAQVPIDAKCVELRIVISGVGKVWVSRALFVRE